LGTLEKEGYRNRGEKKKHVHGHGQLLFKVEGGLADEPWSKVGGGREG